ncbi:hypothetical protein [Bacillus cytotoxicus]|uniref:hypothetical protein n=1 Tax=Bacillus cytotoxicus TaxID=580165 RepID=UPI003D7ED7E7
MSLIVLCSFLALSAFGPNAVQLLAIKFSTITDTIFSFPAPALYSKRSAHLLILFHGAYRYLFINVKCFNSKFPALYNEVKIEYMSKFIKRFST